MRVSAKADYAVRAALELAAASDARPLKREQISAAQKIPSKFLETIMLELKHAGIVKSTRGAVGGYSLARPAQDISVADVIRAVDGPLADVHDESVRGLAYPAPAESLPEVWMAVRASLRSVLETVSIADLVAHDLPSEVTDLAATYRETTEQRYGDQRAHR